MPEIIFVTSYNEGEEYVQKLDLAARLREQGLSIEVGHLFELIDGALPREDVANIVFRRLSLWAENVRPKTLAFHAGIAIRLRAHAFTLALERFRLTYPDIECVLEPASWYRNEQFLKEDGIRYFVEKIPALFDRNEALVAQIWPPK